MAHPHLPKLKTFLFYSFFIFACIFCFISLQKQPVSYYKQKETIIQGNLDSFTVDGNLWKGVLKGKESLAFFYTIKSEKEKEDLKHLHIGSKITIKGTLEKPEHRRNFYLFDYQNYLKSKHIYWTLTIEEIVNINQNTNLFYRIKQGILNRIQPLQSKEYLKAFLLGDKSDLDPESIQENQKLGISHLFAISGMHITILSSILLFLCNHTFLKRYSYYFVCLFLCFYLILTNFSPSLIRATFFFFLLTWNLQFKKKINTLHGLIAFFSCQLFIHPFIVYDIGFCFSYSCCFFLLLFSSWIRSYKGYIKPLFITSFLAFLASFPISVSSFFEVSILSPFFNLLFVPLVTFLLFPGALLTFVFPSVDPIYIVILNLFEWLKHVLEPFAYMISFPHISFWGQLILYFIFLSACFLLKQKQYYGILFLIISFFLCYEKAYFSPKNQILMLDVGQGDSTLIISKFSDKAIMIDTGGKIEYQMDEWKKRSTKSQVEQILLPSLKAHGIHTIEALILTHGDQDHLGNAFELIQAFPVKKVFMNKGNDNPKEKQLKQLCQNKGIQVESIDVKKQVINNHTFSFLNTKNETNENEDSLITYTIIDQMHLLFMGDAGSSSEKKLLNAYKLPKVDILKVGHHGSKYSSSKEFLNVIRPTYAFISAGVNNHFSHPHLEVLTRLNELGAQIFITAQHGAIKVITSPKKDIEICLSNVR